MDEAVDPWVLLARPLSELPTLVAAFVLIWAFLFGSAWGSFLNVVIARLPEGISVVSPRSRCPKCGTMIAWYDNIPLFSWIALRARCRSCKTPISARYPFVELLLGLAGMAVVARAGLTFEALQLFVLIAILVAVSFIDLDTWTIPLVLPAILAVGGVAVAIPLGTDAVVARLIGLAGGLLGLGAVVVVSTWVFRKTGKLGPDEWAMGWGDPLLLGAIGAALGWQALPLVLFLASLQGAVIGLVLKAQGKLRGGQPVSETDDWRPPEGALPFGPFLAMGALEVAFFGSAISSWVLPLLEG